MNKTQNLTRIAHGLMRGLNGSRSPLVAEALKLTDPESATSLVSIVAAYTARTAQINGDRELSDIGKRERMKAAADNSAGHVGRLARRVVELEAKHRSARENAVQLPKAEMADVLLDLELARHVREVNQIPSKLTQMSERIRVAVARLPVELTGITSAVQAQVLGSLVSPELAAQLAEEDQALSTVRSVVQSAIDELAPVAELPPREMVETFGTAWRLPGVAQTMADRLSAEANSDAEQTDDEHREAA